VEHQHQQAHPRRTTRRGNVPQFIAVVAAAGGGLQLHQISEVTAAAAEAALKQAISNQDVILATIAADRFQGMVASIGRDCRSKTGEKQFVSLCAFGPIVTLIEAQALNAPLVGSAIEKAIAGLGRYICTLPAADLRLAAHYFTASSGDAVVQIQGAGLN